MSSTRPLALSFVVVLVAASPCAGCMVGPNYQRPQPPVPPAHRFAEGTPTEASLADLPWWEVMKDPVLQKLIREALAGNLDLRTATARVAEARAQYGIAKSFLFPEVGALRPATRRSRSRGSSEPSQGTAAGKTYQNYSAAIPLSWEIDLFGRIRRDKEAAFAAVPRHRGGPARGRPHARGRRRLDLPLPARAGPRSSRWRAAPWPPTRRRCAFYDEAAGGRRLEPPRGRPRVARTASRTAAVIPRLERQIAVAENALSLLLGRPPGPIERGASAHRGPRAPGDPRRACRRRSSSGGPTCSPPSSSSSPRTRTSARRRRSSSRPSRSPASSARSAASSRTC